MAASPEWSHPSRIVAAVDRREEALRSERDRFEQRRLGAVARDIDRDVDASEIEVEVANCEVTLRGMVDNRDQKRWAERLAESVRGVTDVHNQLRVKHSLLDRAVEKVKDAFGVELPVGAVRESGTVVGDQLALEPVAE